MMPVGRDVAKLSPSAASIDLVALHLPSFAFLSLPSLSLPFTIVFYAIFFFFFSLVVCASVLSHLSWML